MNILVVNCGSSSLKYQLLNMDDESVIAKGNCERIGIDGSFIKHTTAGQDSVKVEVAFPDHKAAISKVLEMLTEGPTACVKLDEIGAVGHRVVHGGEKFNESVVITPEVEAAIDECSALAPLHNPANLIGINACRELMPSVPMAAVFDTAFHQTMPAAAYTYAIPQEYYEKYGVRKYGFHGTSHRFVSQEAARMLGKPIEDTKIIVCHLGNGASICAVDGGKSVETSMGFTPLAGLVMGTRSGDIDPAVVTFIMEKEGLTAKEMDTILNKKSGVDALSQVSSDFREVIAGVDNGDPKCILAMDAYYQRVIEYIGAYIAAMNGVDAICFTAGVGENSTDIRKGIISRITTFGIELDEEANKKHGEEAVISTPNSKIKLLLIPTNEELMIARDTLELVSK